MLRRDRGHGRGHPLHGHAQHPTRQTQESLLYRHLRSVCT